jgi:hypothetical protein
VIPESQYPQYVSRWRTGQDESENWALVLIRRDSEL